MKRAPGQEQAVADVLALTRVKGLGDDGLAKLLDQLRREGREPADLYRASPAHLREHFSLRSETAEIVGREAPRLMHEGGELYRNLRSLGARVLLPATAEYPERLESFYGSAPPVLYAYGNPALLDSACFAIVSSALPSAEALAYTFALASRLAEAGKTLLASPETPSYNLVGLGGKRASRVIVLHRGLLDFFDDEAGREPLPLARHAGGEIDAHTSLLLSPFRPAGRWQKGNGPRRDQLLVALADTIVAMEVKPSGRMEELCLKAHATERRVFACQFAGSPAPPAANEALLAAGATPLVPDEAGSNIDLLLRDGATALNAAATADDLPRRRALGQYFTPSPVAKFIWDALIEYGHRVIWPMLGYLDVPSGARRPEFQIENPFNDKPLRIDFLLHVGDIPMLTIEGEPHARQFEQGLREAKTYSKNFRPRQRDCPTTPSAFPARASCLPSCIPIAPTIFTFTCTTASIDARLPTAKCSKSARPNGISPTAAMTW